MHSNPWKSHNLTVISAEHDTEKKINVFKYTYTFRDGAGKYRSGKMGYIDIGLENLI